MKKTDELPLHFKVQGKIDDADGIYLIPHPTTDDYFYNIVFSTGMGWEHLSVSLRKMISRSRRSFSQVQRCPTWPEMCFLKNLFWMPSEATVQFHPAMADYVNNHEFVLHIFKPTSVVLPTPDPIMVGLKDETLTHLLQWLEKEQPGCDKEYYLSALYYADYSKVNLRDEKSLEEFKAKLLVTL
jgi:hypothetical protein